MNECTRTSKKGVHIRWWWWWPTKKRLLAGGLMPPHVRFLVHFCVYFAFVWFCCSVLCINSVNSNIWPNICFCVRVNFLFGVFLFFRVCVWVCAIVGSSGSVNVGKPFCVVLFFFCLLLYGHSMDVDVHLSLPFPSSLSPILCWPWDENEMNKHQLVR